MPDPVRNAELVNAPLKLAGVLEAAGFTNVRAWATSTEIKMSVEKFFSDITSSGRSRRRLESLALATRARCLARVRSRIEATGAGAAVERTEVVYAVGSA